MRDWARWLRHHSHAWISSLLLHAVVFLLVLWWGVLPLVPGQGAVEVWLVGGVPGGGGASGSGPAGQGRPPGSSLHESQPKGVTKSVERIAEAPKESQATKEEPPPATTPRVLASTAPGTSHAIRQEPTAPSPLRAEAAFPDSLGRLKGETEPASLPGEAEGARQSMESAERKEADQDETAGDENVLKGNQSQESRVGDEAGEGSTRQQAEGDGGSGTGAGYGLWIGRGGGGGRGGDWRLLLLKRIEEAKRYPDQARRLGMEGVAEVEFRVAGDGSVESVTVVKSSGFPLLDRASIETIKRAAPFPPVSGAIRVPISYHLREGR